MSTLLVHLTDAVVPLLHPALPAPGQAFVRAFAEWVGEWETEWPERAKEPVKDAHLIHESRFECPFGRPSLGTEFLGYRNPDRSVRTRSLDRGIADALAHGVVTAWYKTNKDTGEVDNHSWHRLTDLVPAAVARATAVADVTAHLAVYPIDVISIDGVATDAKALTGSRRKVRQFERTIEEHHPEPAAECARLLLRKVELEYIGVLGGVDHPEWCPTGFDAAKNLLAVAAELTGVPVVASTPPAVTYRGSRIVWTTELAELLPELSVLPRRLRLTPKEAADEGADVVTDDLAERRPAPRKASRPKGASGGAASWNTVIEGLESEAAA